MYRLRDVEGYPAIFCFVMFFRQNEPWKRICKCTVYRNSPDKEQALPYSDINSIRSERSSRKELTWFVINFCEKTCFLIPNRVYHMWVLKNAKGDCHAYGTRHSQLVSQSRVDDPQEIAKTLLLCTGMVLCVVQRNGAIIWRYSGNMGAWSGYSDPLSNISWLQVEPHSTNQDWRAHVQPAGDRNIGSRLQHIW